MKEKKKLFVVSDVHGHYTLLKEALDKAGFDKENENHLLICCGDYFDRGRENAEVLRFFERLKHKVLLRGNHEDLLLNLFKTGKFLPHNYINGTMTTLENFLGKYAINPVDDTIDFSGKTRIVDRICDFIEGTENYFETENYLFVHGWVPEGVKAAKDCQKVDNQGWEKARWIKWTERYEGENPLLDKTLVCGHMPTFFAKFFDETRGENNYDTFYGKGLIAIDAGTFDTQRINVLVLEDAISVTC